MNETQTRLWPGLIAVALQWLVFLGAPLISKDATIYALLGGLLGGLFILVWWMFFSRAPRLDRWGAPLLIVAAMLATMPLLDRSIAEAGMGRLFPIFAIPGLSLALVAGAWAGRRLALVAAILLACGVWTLVRSDGIVANGGIQLAWRWTATPEEKLLARTNVEPPPPPVSIVVQSPPVWPGFRGPNRDSIIPGLRIQADWAASPPKELWRRPIGPAWSSFAVSGDLIFTQEQRGEFEVVSCYKLTTGEPVWSHRDATRFWEANAGPGPRSTPSLSGGRVYTFGATGIVNALNASDGSVVWTRNAATDTGAKLPAWGFSSSPLLVDDYLIVAASGRLAAYNLDSGELRWNVQTGGGSYSSPHLLTIDGVKQVVLLNSAGAVSVSPADGKTLWKHEWPGSTILQPALTTDGGLLITTGDMSGGLGTRRLAVAKGPEGWTVKEQWTSKGLKPYFNDLVIHNGHAFGFDGSILSCIDLKDGTRKWKGGRYGHGQMLLLPSQDLLLVLSEEGEIALVEAATGQFTEVSRFRAMDDKTWNHPVIADGILLVRNGQEMVAFRLPRAAS